MTGRAEGAGLQENGTEALKPNRCCSENQGRPFFSDLLYFDSPVGCGPRLGRKPGLPRCPSQSLDLQRGRASCFSSTQLHIRPVGHTGEGGVAGAHWTPPSWAVTPNNGPAVQVVFVFLSALAQAAALLRAWGRPAATNVLLRQMVIWPLTPVVPAKSQQQSTNLRFF